MSDKTGHVLFVKATDDTHKRLSVLAAQLGIGRGELYSQAIRWAIRQKDFTDALAKVYKRN